MSETCSPTGLDVSHLGVARCHWGVGGLDPGRSSLAPEQLLASSGETRGVALPGTLGLFLEFWFASFSPHMKGRCVCVSTHG